MLLAGREGLMKVFVESEMKNRQWRIKKVRLITPQRAENLLDY